MSIADWAHSVAALRMTTNGHKSYVRELFGEKNIYFLYFNDVFLNHVPCMYFNHWVHIC